MTHREPGDPARGRRADAPEAAPRPSDDATDPLAADQRASRVAAPAGLPAASRFLGRLAQVDLAALGEAIHLWRQSVVEPDGAWFAAESAIPEAIHATRRYAEQEMLLRLIADLFLDAPWFTAADPGTRIGAAEPAAQYVATLAMLALLVRERLAPSAFELLYRPFVRVIPDDELGRE